MKSNGSDEVVLHVPLPQVVRRELKALAARRGISLRELAREALQAAIPESARLPVGATDGRSTGDVSAPR